MKLVISVRNKTFLDFFFCDKRVHCIIKNGINSVTFKPQNFLLREKSVSIETKL